MKERRGIRNLVESGTWRRGFAAGLGIAALALLIGAAAARAEDAPAKACSASAEDEATIRASAPAWADAYNAGDAETLAAMYWEDAVLQPPGAPAASGHAAIRDFLGADSAATRDAGLTMNIPEAGAVDISGSLAYEAGTYTVTDASGAVVDAGKYIGVFEKRGDTWRYIRDTWNSDLGAPAAPEE